MSKISDYLRNRRKELNMRQIQVAKQMKTSNRAISQHESGKRIPKLEALLEYSKIYRVSIYKLVDLRIEDIKGGETNDTNKNS